MKYGLQLGLAIILFGALANLMDQVYNYSQINSYEIAISLIDISFVIFSFSILYLKKK